MVRTLTLMFSLALLAGCKSDCHEPVVIHTAGADPTHSPLPGRTITVSGTAEISTAPDTFELTIGFDVQNESLERVRDESQRRAAALLAVASKHQIPDCDVQTQDLSLQPRYDSYEHRKIVGYSASRGLVLTLRNLDGVEAVLYDMLAAGANRVDRVQFHSSAAREKRAEARVLAVKAARDKAEAMAQALGQTIGQPLRVEEDASAGGGWRAPIQANYALMNETVPHVSDTLATGKIQIQASVAVTFALSGG
jgi:hypothetical protein